MALSVRYPQPISHRRRHPKNPINRPVQTDPEKLDPLSLPKSWGALLYHCLFPILFSGCGLSCVGSEARKSWVDLRYRRAFSSAKVVVWQTAKRGETRGNDVTLSTGASNIRIKATKQDLIKYIIS